MDDKRPYQRISIPVGYEQVITLRARMPITDAEWNQFMLRIKQWAGGGWPKDDADRQRAARTVFSRDPNPDAHLDDREPRFWGFDSDGEWLED